MNSVSYCDRIAVGFFVVYHLCMQKKSADPQPNHKEFDVFLSHNWGTPPAIANHKRVVAIARQLTTRGLRVWVDENEMHAHLPQAMTEGIDQSKVVLVFITEEYLAKVCHNRSSKCITS